MLRLKKDNKWRNPHVSNPKKRKRPIHKTLRRLQCKQTISSMSPCHNRSNLELKKARNENQNKRRRTHHSNQRRLLSNLHKTIILNNYNCQIIKCNPNRIKWCRSSQPIIWTHHKCCRCRDVTRQNFNKTKSINSLGKNCLDQIHVNEDLKRTASPLANPESVKKDTLKI